MDQEHQRIEANIHHFTYRLPFGYAKRKKILVEYHQNLGWRLYYCQPIQSEIYNEVRRVLKVPFEAELIDEDIFEQKLTRLYQRDSSEAHQLMQDISADSEDFFVLAEELPQNEDLLEAEDDAPMIKLINAMLAEAIKEGASDIHVETFERKLAIRFRIDGILRLVLTPNRKLAPLLVSRIKVMAKLDIAEKRIPQDGRISLYIGGRPVDVRVSTMPSAYGERVVLRLLDKNSTNLDLSSLGMSGHVHQGFDQLLKRPHGIILVTGPTGSGKSTTLYAGLSNLNSTERNILTVEDPIEFSIEGIGQTQVNHKVDMTFARGLRAMLRQDPDVVMVGEIRDLETAQIAVQASLTGHLVISTLHTNTAVGAITRLRDMQIEPFLISSSLVGILAQRLVRKLCSDCKKPYQADAIAKNWFGLDPKEQLNLYKAVGCKQCHYKGYQGRTGIHELLIVDDKIQQLIHDDEGEQVIMNYLRDGKISIRHDGLDKIRQGMTTPEEVMRVTRER